MKTILTAIAILTTILLFIWMKKYIVDGWPPMKFYQMYCTQEVWP